MERFKVQFQVCLNSLLHVQMAETAESPSIDTSQVNNDGRGSRDSVFVPIIAPTSFYSQTFKRRVAVCSFCSAFLIIFLPILFLVVIPGMIRNTVDKTNVAAQSAFIVCPTNQSFETSVVLVFSQSAPIPAHMQMKEIIVSWDGQNGGDLISLTKSDKIQVTKKPTQVHSLANVRNHQALSSFTEYAMNSKSCEWHLKGEADVTAIITTTVSLDKKVTLSGFNGFSIPPEIKSVSMVRGTKDTLVAATKATLTSEATIGLVLNQDLHFSAKSNGIVIGTGVIANATLSVGAFEVEPELSLLGSATASSTQFKQVMKLASNFAMGLPTDIVLDDFHLKKETEVDWLKPALRTMSLDATVPGVPTPLITNITVYISTALRSKLEIPFTGVFYNSFDVPIYLGSLQGSIFFRGTKIATVDIPSISPALYLPPKQLTVSNVPLKGKALLAALPLVHDINTARPALVDIRARVGGHFGEYPFSMVYNQTDVVAKVYCDDKTGIISPNLC